MSDIRIIQGEIFKDYRGQISSLNEFHFEGVRRCYIIHHPDESVVRGWHGHQFERKWFYCIKGSFALALVEIDDWNAPSHDLEPKVYQLNENHSRIVTVPAGYANCMKALEEDSIMIVYSDKTLEEASNDNWKFDKDLWVNWSQY